MIKKVKPIDEIDPISINEFYNRYVKTNTPVIINNLNSSWKARNLWNLDYFNNNFGDTHVETVDIMNKTYLINTEKGSKASFNKMSAAIGHIKNASFGRSMAVATAISYFSDKLNKDYNIIEYCKNGSFLRTRLFIGGADIVTPLHQDLYENLYTVVKGEKKIILYSPKDSKHLYRYPFFSRFPNGSRIDPQNINTESFPNAIKAESWVCSLKEGQTLFIPSYWWHYLENQKETIAISFWWGYGIKLIPVFLAAVYKKLRGI